MLSFYKNSLVVITILFIFLPGCAYLLGPEEGGFAPPPGSATPYVIFTNPANGMANVQRTGAFMVQVEFSQEMNPQERYFTDNNRRRACLRLHILGRHEDDAVYSAYNFIAEYNL